MLLAIGQAYINNAAVFQRIADTIGIKRGHRGVRDQQDVLCADRCRQGLAIRQQGLTDQDRVGAFTQGNVKLQHGVGGTCGS